MKKTILLVFLVISLSLMIHTAAAQEEESFILEVDIADSYKKVPAGEKFLFSIKIMNLGSNRRVDVALDYKIRDSVGDIIMEKRETVAVETQASFVGVFDLLESTQPGEYTLHTEIIREGERVAVANNSFEIVRKYDKKIYYVLIIFIVLVLLYFAAVKAKSLVEKIRIRLKIHRIVKNKNL